MEKFKKMIEELAAQIDLDMLDPDDAVQELVDAGMDEADAREKLEDAFDTLQAINRRFAGEQEYNARHEE